MTDYTQPRRELHRALGTIFEAERFAVGSLHLSRYTRHRIQDEAFFVQLGPEEAEALVAYLLEGRQAQETPPFTPEEHRQMLRDIVRHGVLPPEEASHLRATIAAQDAAEETTLDDALHVLAQYGWQAVPPAAPPADHAAAETVLDHCLRSEHHRSNSGDGPDTIRAQLATWGIPADNFYAGWATELARVSEGRYPVEEESQPWK